MSDSIFDRLFVEPVEVKRPKRVETPLDTEKEANLISILLAPLQHGETAHFGFARKEAELVTAFAAFTVNESRTVHARLANPRGNDPLAAAFMRMTYERRTRVIGFLADARRREALAYCRRA